MKKNLFYSFFILIPLFVNAQAPAGYYDAANNKNGQPLRIALHQIIKNHTVKSYGSLWSAFHQTDKKSNGQVWDIYSDNPNGQPPYIYHFGTDQCGQYNQEGDCYNREHSWPKSYFNNSAPMNSDLFHIYPTDGFVNGKRSNYSYGMVGASNPWYSQNGSKLGMSDPSIGYSGIVFEPIDDYKGDLARTYFYMSTRYYSEDGGWQSWPMANGADLTPWAAAMLLEWHIADPVSSKEIDRNNAIYEIQNNRNPFIDHPEFADCIWGNGDCTTLGLVATQNEPLSIQIYPNPASTKVMINWEVLNPAEVVAIDFMNTHGQLLYHQQKQAFEKQAQIDVSTYSNGIYWIRITNQQKSITKKIVVN